MRFTRFRGALVLLVALVASVGMAASVLPASADTVITAAPAGVPAPPPGTNPFHWDAQDGPKAGQQDGGAHTDLIGGMPATERYEGMVSVMRRFPEDPNWHTCGGTLAFHTWVLINAHCVTDDNGNALDPALFHVRVGSNNRTEGGETAEVTGIIAHPGWDWGTGVKGADRFWDMAMMRLDHYIQLQPFNIPGTFKPTPAPVREIGWGVTEPEIVGPLPFMLQQLDSHLLPNAMCGDSAAGFPGADEGELCVDTVYGTDTVCYGDSGSPLLQHVRSDSLWEAIGGTSRSGMEPGCVGGRAVYTNWTEFENRRWIYAVAEFGQAPPWSPPARPVKKKAVDNGPATKGGPVRPGGPSRPVPTKPASPRPLAVVLPTAPVLPPDYR